MYFDSLNVGVGCCYQAEYESRSPSRFQKKTISHDSVHDQEVDELVLRLLQAGAVYFSRTASLIRLRVSISGMSGSFSMAAI